MAVARVNRVLSISWRKFHRESHRFDLTGERQERKKSRLHGTCGKTCLGILAGIAFGSCAAVFYHLDKSVKALENTISLPNFPWAFNGTFKSFDHASLRRGWLVYRTVCHTCHSLRYVRFLDLVNVSHTREEVKAIAAEFEVEDGPDEEGNYFTRPCRLSDMVPGPYPNEQAAKAANFGAYPPDLTYMTLARKRGMDYIFSLLTGWMDPPAGIHMNQGQYFNIYFPGGFTTMPQMFHEGMLEYDDGTPATVSQMAKDVVEFLSWSAAPEHDTRKIMTLKIIGIFLILTIAMLNMNKRNWSHIRSRRIAYIPPTKRSTTTESRDTTCLPLDDECADRTARKKRGALPPR